MKSIVKAIILLVIVQLSFYNHSYACWPTGDVTWTGNTNSDWNTASNYSGNWGLLPGNTDRVIINPNNYSNAPVIDNSPTFSPASIYLENGASLTINESITTAYFEVRSGNNTVIIDDGEQLSVSNDFLLSSNNGRISLTGGGSVEVDDDVIFENNATRLTNNLTGNFLVNGDVVFDAITSRMENSGNFSITGDLTTGDGLSAGNRIQNNSGGVFTIGGNIDFNGAANTIDNDGTINQSGNFIGIDAASVFDNKAGGVWTWTYTSGSPDPDMVSVLEASGTVVYAGAGAQDVLPIVYNNLTISGSGTKQLQGAASVNGVLNLSGGHLALNDADLIINGSASIINVSSSNFVITNGNGRLVQANIGSGGRTGDILFPVGTTTASYTPLIINNAGATDNFSVNMAPVIYDGGYSGIAQTSDVVNKTWFIDEEVIGGSDVTLTFQWNDADQLSGFSPTSVRIIHYDGSVWETMAAGSASGSGTYTMSASNISSFSPFGIEGEGGTLPVELLYFKGSMKGEVAALEWATASELNNDFFTLEKTVDLEQYEKVAVVTGNGTTEERNIYQYYDNNLTPGTSYYRLKQTDFDGSFTYSDIIKVSNSSTLDVVDVAMFPVPSQGEFIKLKMSGLPSDKETVVLIYNAQGQLVYQQSSLISNHEEITIRFSNKLATGVYTVRINASEPVTKQFVVK